MRVARYRTIAVITGSRAEYGLLRGLMGEIAADSALALQVVVTGSHLETRFGETWREIEADGHVISARAPLRLDDDSPVGVARSMARGLSGMAEALDRLRPDLAVVLGDRYEILAAAQAAMLGRVPIAHIHGGEASEGAMDEAIRHAVTKLSHLHFAAAPPYRRRIIQMGEDPGRVFDVGALALDGLAALPRLDRAEVEARLGIRPDRPFVVVTYHPVTLDQAGPAGGIEALRAALDGFPGHHVVLTGVNADPGHDVVAAACGRWAEDEPGRVTLRQSLGQVLYFSAVRHADAVLGNSSSGIIEAPAIGTPTVNMGARQAGRLRAASVVDCDETAEGVAAALRRTFDPDFRREAASAPYPFGTAGAAARIARVLREVSLDGLLVKRFHDLRGEGP